jgi:type II secretory pathway pseudopilin PulG
MANARHNVGLTLIETLVVVAVIALLASLVIAITLRIENQSKERGVENLFALLRSALQEYYEDTDSFPLQAVRDPTGAAAHIERMYGLLNSVPASRQVLTQINRAFVSSDATPGAVPRIQDPWGTVLDYVYGPDDHFPELTSAGPDKKFGTADDISSKNT